MPKVMNKARRAVGVDSEKMVVTTGIQAPRPTPASMRNKANCPKLVEKYIGTVSSE
jgi:hypothetical protein